MDDHIIRTRESESEDDMHSDNFMPIQRMGSKSKSFRRQNKSRSRSRNGSSSPQKMGRYTPPLTNGRFSPTKNHVKEIADEPISILDPRRFTPTLHANLVAEILSLRRELEAKGGLIESLEYDLSAARAETETTATSVASARKEARDIRQQLKEKENDEALEILSYERDEALETVGELKRQVERLTKSRRKAEEDLDRNRQIVDNERAEWETNKRSLEHRVHVAEGRLKTLLQEIASANETNSDETLSNQILNPENLVRPVSRNSIRSIASSVSEGFDTDKNGIRFSMINVEASQSGLRLAEELSFIDEAGETSEAETEASVYPESVAEMHHDVIPDVPDASTEAAPIEIINENLIPSRRSSGALSPSLTDCRSEITEGTIMAADEEELKDLRQDNKRLMEMVEHLEECIKLEQQDRENYKIAMANDLEDWKEKYDKQAQDYRAREFQELQEREVLQREHQDQLELLESIAADTQHQLELLATERAELKRSMEESLKARQEELDEENAPAVESVLQAILDEVLDETVVVEELPPIVEKEEEPVVEAVKPVQTPRNSVVFHDDMPQSPREISANQGRKRISLIGPVSPPLSPPSTITRRSSTAAYISSEAQTTDVVIAEPGVDVACQTDKPPTPPQSPTFIIPSIAIYPPPPAIVSYEPKPVRDAGCQTFQSPHTKSSSMQTEAIKVDTRILLKKFAAPPPPQREAPKPPAPTPVAIPAPVAAPTIVESPVPMSPPATTLTSAPATVSPPPNVPERSTRRPLRAPLTRLNTAPSAVTTTKEQVESPTQSPPGAVHRSLSEDAIAPLPVMSPNGVYRPPRTTSLWKYNDIPSDEDDDEIDVEEAEDEFKTALSAPRPPKPKSDGMGIGPTHRDSMLPKRHPSVKRNMATTKPMLPSRAWNHTLPGANGRRLSGMPIGPPYPVPLRHSSRKLPPSITSSRASSPSPMPGGIRRTRNSIRKSRSAMVLKTAEGSVRTRSPPPMSLSSAAPESPTDIPPLPRDTILPNSMNRPNYASHRYQDSSVTGTASIDSSQQQTSVVDAIAQTMIGEFLYKYVRKRFGQIQDSPQGWEKDDGGSGARHKRWVWLAPYERSVMWSTRQPTSGTALLGKTGRKLLIQSVLDVKDDTPPPKGVTLFNRSILILTPARALKFTASTQERHYVWLMALSFLAHSSQSPGTALTLPPALPFEVEQLTQRSETREGKGKEKATAYSYMSGNESEYYDSRPAFNNPFSANGSFTNHSAYTFSNPDDHSAHNRRTSRYGSVFSDDSAAEYPTVARHSRKRSNTAYPSISAPRIPPARNFTSPTFSGSGYSGSHRVSNSITSSDFNCNIPGPGASALYNDHRNSALYNDNRNSAIYNDNRNSVISNANSGQSGGNFFDAIPTGTMRMEAFIDSTPKVNNYEEDDFFPDLSRAFQGRSSNRNSRVYGQQKSSFLDFYGHQEEQHYGKSRYSEEDDMMYHRRDQRDLFAGF